MNNEFTYRRTACFRVKVGISVRGEKIGSTFDMSGVQSNGNKVGLQMEGTGGVSLNLSFLNADTKKKPRMTRIHTNLH